MRNNIIFLFLSFGFFFLSCKKNKHSYDELKRSQIISLLNEATKQKDTMMNVSAADSLVDIALSKALRFEDSLMIASCYISSLKDKDLEKLSIKEGQFFLRQALNYADKLESPNLATNAYFQMCEFLLEKKQPEEAAVILGIATNTQKKNEKNEIQKLIVQSKINRQQNQSFEQLKSLLDAQYMASDIENDSLQYISLKLLSDFYFIEGNYEQSLEYTQKMKQILQSHHPVDSIKWYYNEANRLSVFVKTMDNNVVYKIGENINNFGKRKNIPQLCTFAQSSLRSCFIDKQDFQGLKIWYSKNKEDLQHLQQNNISLYYRIKAYIAEQDQKKDSAKIYFELAGQDLESQNPYYLYNYHLRKSELEERNNFASEAENDLEIAHNYSIRTKLYKEQFEYP